MAKLSNKQDAFCRQYLVDFNATQAAIRAGYSPKTANPQASRLLTKVTIQERIAELKAQADASTSWDAAWVREQMKLLYVDCVESGNQSVASGLINTMSKCESMQSDKLELTGRQQISFNIKTGKKPK